MTVLLLGLLAWAGLALLVGLAIGRTIHTADEAEQRPPLRLVRDEDVAA